MNIKIEIDVTDEDIYAVIACLDIEGRKIHEKSVREFIKTYIKQASYDALYSIDKPYRDPGYKYFEYYQEAKEKMRMIYIKGTKKKK